MTTASTSLQLTDSLTFICAALKLPVSHAQLSALVCYTELLGRWNRVINLTAVRDRETMLSHHLADCLATVSALGERLVAGRLLDVGSGGGLPGVVVAIMLPHVQVVCIDAVAKKAAFIQQVAGSVPLPNLRSRHGRVEQLQDGAFDIVAARAFASLADFCHLTRAHLTDNGVWMAMKGRVPTDEIAKLPPGVDAFHVEHLQVPGLAAERCLVWMRDMKRLRRTSESSEPSASPV